MGDRSKITWTETTWNPVTGCSPVSPGCDNCYAASITHRFAKGQTRKTSDGRIEFNGTIKLHHDRVEQPLSWRKPRLVFVCSMSDLFHHSVPDEFLWRVFDVMRQADKHTFQLLTKRPERAVPFVDEYLSAFPLESLENIWLGVTAEDQKRYEKRVPLLAECSLSNKWVSVEPMIGPVHHTVPLIDAMVIGCESLGSRLGRHMDLSWTRLLVHHCGSLGTLVHVKQIGVDGRVSKNMSEWPEDLRIRQWPEEASDG